MQELLEPQERLVTKGLQVQQDLPEHRETLGQLDHKDLLERKVFPVTMELLVTEDLLGQREHLEHKDQLAPGAKLDQLETEDLQATQVRWVHRDLLDFQETSVNLDQLDRRETLASQVTLVPLAPLELPASRVITVQ
jgi:hypothetical protein